MTLVLLVYAARWRLPILLRHPPAEAHGCPTLALGVNPYDRAVLSLLSNRCVALYANST